MVLLQAAIDDSMDHLTPEELEALEAQALEASKKRAAEWPTDEKGIEDWLNSMPLLASKQPQGEATGDFEVIADLVKSTAPTERANNFKNSGNAAYSLGIKGDKTRMRHALVYYTQGLEAGSTDKSTLAALHSNRALVHLALENYGNCIQDCMHAITYIPTNVKPFYRAAQASFALGKHQQALNFIQGGRTALKSHLLVEDEKVMLNKLEKSVQQAIEDKVRQEKEKEAKAAGALSVRSALQEALSNRKLIVGPPLLDLAGYDPPEPYVDTNGRLHWPVLFLYEKHMTSDFIRDFDEATTLAFQLSEMFPTSKAAKKEAFAPWDSEREFYLSNLRVYVEGPQGRLEIKQLKTSLADIINSKTPSFTIPQIPTFFVTPKA